MKHPFELSIIDYLGKVDGGLLILIGITYEKKYYEATFFYNETEILFTISDELEKEIGDIKKHPAYADILKDILRKIVPFNEMYDRSDEVDFSRWVQVIAEIYPDENSH
jgi:hypothetical protein